jgi:hypothetical protein
MSFEMVRNVRHILPLVTVDSNDTALTGIRNPDNGTQ